MSEIKKNWPHVQRQMRARLSDCGMQSFTWRRGSASGDRKREIYLRDAVLLPGTNKRLAFCRAHIIQIEKESK